MDACAELVEAVLSSCPGTTVLATSQEELRIASETVWRVPPLSLPIHTETPVPERLLGSEAVQLFLDRATSLGDFARRAVDAGGRRPRLPPTRRDPAGHRAGRQPRRRPAPRGDRPPPRRPPRPPHPRPPPGGLPAPHAALRHRLELRAAVAVRAGAVRAAVGVRRAVQRGGGRGRRWRRRLPRRPVGAGQQVDGGHRAGPGRDPPLPAPRQPAPLRPGAAAGDREGG